MQEAHLEHANLTASNPDAMAAILCDIFDWQIRWSGEAMDNGYTVHVGGDNSYIAIYTNDRVRASNGSDGNSLKNLNHLGVVVSDLKSTEERVSAAGLKPHSHRHYDNQDSRFGPSSNFYFHMLDDLEIEVISYH